MSWKHTFYKDGKWRWPRIVAAVIGGFIAMIGFAALFGLVVQALWNWIVPAIFGLREITYLEAFGIMLLARLLVGGFGGSSGGGYSGKRYRHHHHHDRHHKYDECGDDCGDDYKDWRYYDEWWHSEGKDSFRKFADSKKIEK